MLFKRNKLPLILQSEMTECGLACLAMIFRFYRHCISLQYLRLQLPFGIKGINAQELKQIAIGYGFNVNIVRIELTKLTSLFLPCILHWGMDHFVVLKKITHNYIVVHDPARGLRKINMEAVNAFFTGIALEIKAPITKYRKNYRSNSLSLLLPLIKKYYFLFLKILFLSFSIQIFYILSIIYVQKTLDAAIHVTNYYALVILMLGFFGLKLMELASFAMRAMLVSFTNLIIYRDLTVKIKKHLLNLPITFFQNRHAGDILSRFNTVDKIRSHLMEGLIESIVDGAMAVILIGFMLHINKLLTWLVLFATILFFLARFLQQQKIKYIQEEIIYHRSFELSFLIETIRGIKAIKIFNKGIIRLTKWLNHFRQNLNLTARLNCQKTLFEAMERFWLAFELTMIILLGSLLLQKHLMSLGMLYAFLMYRQQFIQLIIRLLEKMQTFYLLTLHVDRLKDILLTKSEKVLFDKENVLPKKNTNSLLLQNISFAYTKDNFLLENINLSLKQGEYLVITGPSGCGKTTLLKIMAALLKPSKGELIFNDRRITADYTHVYRQNIACVLQDDILFSGTISENITFFAKEVDYAHLNHCMQIANIRAEIDNLPMGYHTFIKGDDCFLSGGQKQRILLARALYSRPYILFLDEATSHLDIIMESKINETIRSLNIIVVMIAHRKETISMADRVFYLSNNHLAKI